MVEKTGKFQVGWPSCLVVWKCIAWKHTDSLPPKKFRLTRSADKIVIIIIIIIINHKGVIYHHSVPPKNTVNGEYNVSILKKIATMDMKKAS